MIEVFFKKSNGIFLIYDISNLNSFESLNFFVDIINKARMTNPRLKIYLIGNFIDKEEERQVSKE